MDYHFVSVEELSQGKTYSGAATLISAHKLELNWKQFSTAQVWIENGPENEKNNIQFGCLAYPAIFEDNYSPLFGYWTVFLGSVLGQTSTYGKSTYELPARVYRDSETGNWWLMFNVIIGYWPGELFTHLGNDASVV
ncbi:uncharacterized protein LOC113280140 [Papaver somniferum]|uniref:uncharacterized protein LOC113280140 n=1 Tax=Papaver somniferum TaxID=3469 RepID=UPI000E7024F9|nr:uncharacterized protein LOC113280140 [Papaver somniferum]